MTQPPTTQALTAGPVLAIDGASIQSAIDDLHRAAMAACPADFADWTTKPVEEREAIVWVRMLEFSSLVQDRVEQIQGAIIAHIQDHDLLRHHPGRSNWGSLSEMIADRVENKTLSPSQRSDLAFIVRDVVPKIRELGFAEERAPSLSVIRTMVPAIRVAIRRQDDDGLAELITRAAAMTHDEAQAAAARPPTVEGEIARQANGLYRVSVGELTAEQAARLRRALPWVEWIFVGAPDGG